MNPLPRALCYSCPQIPLHLEVCSLLGALGLITAGICLRTKQSGVLLTSLWKHCGWWPLVASLTERSESMFSWPPCTLPINSTLPCGILGLCWERGGYISFGGGVSAWNPNLKQTLSVSNAQSGLIKHFFFIHYLM